MLFKNLTETEIKMMDDYRRMYAFSSESTVYNPTFCDMEYLLRAWQRAKSEYLYNLFGQQFIISKPVSYEKPLNDLYREVVDMRSGTTHFGKKKLTGKVFYDAFWDWMRRGEAREFDENVREHLFELIDSWDLAKNHYSGEPFSIPLPNGKELRVLKAAGVIRVLSKIADAYHLPGFEDFRICHSQILNQRFLSGTLTLSIHPLDYMTMSDNNCGWESCMSWKNEGGYRLGTVEMMNSDNAIVAYLSAEDPMMIRDTDGIDQPWSDKKWRSLFVVDEVVLASVKAYPYANDSLTCEVLNWVRELAKTNLNWEYGALTKFAYDEDDAILSDGTNARLQFNTGSMYNDFGCVDYHWMCLASNLTEEDTATGYNRKYVTVEYSGFSECMVCGELDPCTDDESCLACEECQNRLRCDCCGEYIAGSSHEIDGMTVCSYCYENRFTECAICGQLQYDDDMSHLHVVPRLSEEEFERRLAEWKNDGGTFCSRSVDDITDFLWLRTTPDQYVCEDCLKAWAEKNLKPGCHIERHYCRWGYYNIVFYEDLLDEVKVRLYNYTNPFRDDDKPMSQEEWFNEEYAFANFPFPSQRQKILFDF